MKIFRFMSNEEFEKYRSGKVMRNKTDHSIKHGGSNTNSKGFCFFDYEEYSAEEAMHFLSGVVTFDVCAVFETDSPLNKTYGEYAKPIKNDGDMLKLLAKLLIGFHDSFIANEYCTTQYDRRTFKLIKYSKNIWQQWNPAEIQKELKWEECNNELQVKQRTKTKNGIRNKAVQT